MSPTERYQVSGSQIVEKVKQLIHEGNIRKVRLVRDGRTLIKLPLSVGAPAAALVTECTIEVEKEEKG